MALGIHKYRLSPRTLAGGTLEGFSYDKEENTIQLDPKSPVHRMVPLRLDSGVEGCIWGRIQLDIQLPPEATFLLHYFASDGNTDYYEQADQIVGGRDGLLNGQQGRYLQLWLEVYGAQTCTVGPWEVWTPDDPFLKTFPQIYREDKGFLKQYLSIFSSIYLDFQDEIENLHQWVDVERAPADKLPALAAWMGVDLSPQLFTPDQMRDLLVRLPKFQAYKGSPQIIKELAELLTGHKTVLVERTNLQDFTTAETQETLDQLYGDTVFDYTLLIHGQVEDQTRKQLECLLRQFQPARSKSNLVFLKPNAHLGTYGYLDVNACLHQASTAVLDGVDSLSGDKVLL